MFRAAMGVDPFCDTYPDAMAALGHRLYLEGVRGGNPDPVRAESLLTEAIRWEAKAIALSPEDFQKTSRISRLFADRYGVSRSGRIWEHRSIGLAARWRSTRTAPKAYGTGRIF